MFNAKQTLTSAMVGILLGLVVLMVVDWSFLLSTDPAKGDAPNQNGNALRSPKISAAARAADQFNKDMLESGMILLEGQSGESLVKPDGSFDEEVLEEIGLDSDEKERVRMLIKDSLAKVSLAMSSRIVSDPRRNISFGEEWDAFYISGDPDKSREILDNLQRDLEGACGDESAIKVFNALKPQTMIACFGRSNVFIQKRRNANSDSFQGRVEFFDPITGMKLRESSVASNSELSALLGGEVSKLLAP